MMSAIETTQGRARARFGTLLIGAVIGFVVAILAALAASVFAPAFITVAFVGGWASTTAVATLILRHTHVSHDWAVDGGLIRSTRRWS